ncbi:hypothetical protein H4R22_000197 [Coemansia sp. RSA 1290]|nr:hypothetical protein BX667DRAFT_503870 [Coemansia mojavensis]KAJ2633771.1 hypothetical protein H4R22_000197 [Coemansia sp. RSA 1290]KAJ2649921.1 hypothetical protein IWW40_002775 [Coemansia sp. RSA 1250]KAJ2670583.1 hypothetical protein IWW42_003889 [Coemansia sp. RSA 1085]
MVSKYLVVLSTSVLTVSAAIEQVQQPGAFAGQQVVDGTGGMFIPANIIEVGYVPQTLVAAQEYANNKDKYAAEHASNAQGARAAESPLFRTMTLSETGSDNASSENSESSEEEQDSSGLDTSTGSNAFGSASRAAILLAFGSIAALY